MKEIIINNCPACQPINKLMDQLIFKGFVLLESRLEDYHFHQLYFKVKGNLNYIENIEIASFTFKDNFLICDCHWSTIELISSYDL